MGVISRDVVRVMLGEVDGVFGEGAVAGVEGVEDVGGDWVVHG